jgi:HPt (histidine-containing phosphotransfer) domain-containing protein
MPINTAQEPAGDVSALQRLERFGGVKLREEITRLFLKEAPMRIASAQASLATGNIEGVRSVAHMLKSSAGQLGAVGMQKMCEQLEKPEPSLDMSRALAELSAELARYSAWLQTTPLA